MTAVVLSAVDKAILKDEINGAPTLSVVVCTYNRACVLRECLASLAGQTLDRARFEVIIVDNNSNDDTAGVAREFTVQHPNFRCVLEQSQGLSHARNRGLKESAGAFVAYIDDDAKASPEWTSAILNFFARSPQADAVGGPYFAHSTRKPPDWFPPEYGSWSLGEFEGALPENQSLQGTNMIFRKDALTRANGFATSIGMAGTKLSYGEETHLILRMRALNMSIYYSHSIVVSHALLEYKLSLWWLLRSAFANGRSSIPIHGSMGGRSAALGHLWRTAKRGVVEFLTGRDRFIKTRIYRAFSPTVWQLGFVIALFEQSK